jgi:hypothetical protein
MDFSHKASKFKADDPGFKSSLDRSLGQTVQGLGQIAEDAGWDDNPIKRYGQEVIDQNPSGINSLEDIADDPWLAFKEASGNAAGFLLPAGTVGLGGKLYGAGRLAMGAAQTGLAAVPSYGGIREQQIQDGNNSPIDMLSAGAGAAAVGWIEQRYGLNRALGLSGAPRNALRNEVAGYGDTALRTMGKEWGKAGLTEGAEELVQNPIEQMAAYQDPTTSENLGHTAFGGAMGFLGGLGLGGIGGVQAGMRHSSTATGLRNDGFVQGDSSAPVDLLAGLDRREMYDAAGGQENWDAYKGAQSAYRTHMGGLAEEYLNTPEQDYGKLDPELRSLVDEENAQLQHTRHGLVQQQMQERWDQRARDAAYDHEDVNAFFNRRADEDLAYEQQNALTPSQEQDAALHVALSGAQRRDAEFQSLLDAETSRINQLRKPLYEQAVERQAVQEANASQPPIQNALQAALSRVKTVDGQLKERLNAVIEAGAASEADIERITKQISKSQFGHADKGIAKLEAAIAKTQQQTATVAPPAPGVSARNPQGLTGATQATETQQGVPPLQAVSQAASEGAVPDVAGNTSESAVAKAAQPTPRNMQILDALRMGETAQAVADKFKLSKGRISQIAKQHNLQISKENMAALRADGGVETTPVEEAVDRTLDEDGQATNTGVSIVPASKLNSSNIVDDARTISDTKAGNDFAKKAGVKKSQLPKPAETTVETAEEIARQERVKAEAKAKADAENKAALSHPEANNAAGDWDGFKSNQAPSFAELADNDKADWIHTYAQALLEDDHMGAIAAAQQELERTLDYAPKVNRDTGTGSRVGSDRQAQIGKTETGSGTQKVHPNAKAAETGWNAYAQERGFPVWADLTESQQFYLADNLTEKALNTVTAELNEAADIAGAEKLDSQRGHAGKAETTISELGEGLRGLLAGLGETISGKKPVSDALEKAKNGKGSLQDVLRVVAANTDSPFVKQLINKLIPLLNAGTPITLQYAAYADTFGGYFTYEDGAGGAPIIKINKMTVFDEKTLAYILIHEAIHAVTENAITNSKSSHLSPAQRVGLRMLEDVYEAVRNDKSLAGEYGLTDIHEFVAEALSNPRFQEKLKSLKADETSEVPPGIRRAVVSLWSKFVSALRSIIGVNNALSKTVAAFDLLAESPSRAVDGKAVGYAATNATAPNEFFTKLKDTLEDVLTNPIGAFKEVGLGWVTLEQMADMFKSGAVRTYVGVMNQMQKMSKDRIYKASLIDQKWANLNKQQQTALSEIMREATRNTYDPDKDTAKAENIMEGVLDSKWAVLPDQAKEVYRAVRDYYQENFELRKKILLDAAAKAKAAGHNTSEVDAMFKKMKGPYFPLMRIGDWYSVGMSQELADLTESIKDANPAEAKVIQKQIDKLRKDEAHYVTSGHLTRGEARRNSKKLSDTLDVTYFNRAEERVRQDMKSIPDLEKIQAYIAADLPKETQAQVRDMMAQMYFDMMPRDSALKRDMNREGVHGEEKDMRRVFASSVLAQAHHISRLQFSQDLNAAMVDIQKETKQNENMRMVFNELKKRSALAMDQDANHPVIDKILQGSYFAHLGLSPAFWLTNMSQVPMITMPWMVARYGLGASNTAMGKAYSDTYAIIKTTYSGKGKTWRSEFDWSKQFKDGTDEAKLMQSLLDRSVLDITIEHDLSAVAQMTHGKVDDVIKMANLPVRVTEMANRSITGLMAYRLARSVNNMSHEAAVDSAVQAINDTQLNYSALNAPRHMQSVFGSKTIARLSMQFRKYQQGMIYLVVKNAYDAVKGGTAEEKAVARKTLMGLFATTGTMAGALGLPFAGTALWFASVIGGLFDDDDKKFDAEVEFRNFLADVFGKDVAAAMSKGILSTIGIDLSKRVGLGDIGTPLPFMRQGKTGAEVVGNATGAFLGAGVGTMATMYDGVQELSQGNFSKGAEKIIPLKLAQNLIRAGRYGTDGMTNTKGEPVLTSENFSAWNLFMRGAGFASMKESEYYSANQAVEGAKQAASDVRSKLLREYGQGKIKGEDTSDVEAKIADFNTRHKTQGVRIDASSKLKAVQERRKMAAQRDESGVKNDKRTKPYLEQGRFATAG